MIKVLLSAAFVVLVQARPHGGSMGFGPTCVVTGNVLYINGLETRNLSSSEQNELSQYQQSIDSYNAAMKSAMDQRKEEMRSNNRYGDNSYRQPQDLPTPPPRPSFCSDDATTQYVFDGCMIQGNKVYIGKQYARDLTSSEVQELQDFDSRLEAYESYLQQQLQQRVNAFIGQSQILSQLMGPTTPAPTTGATSSPGPAPQAPTAPNFCTSIY